MTTPLSVATSGVDDHAASDSQSVVGEPLVDIPAGIIGEAIELLAVAHELIAAHPSCCVNIRLHELIEHTVSVKGSYDTYTAIRAGFGRTATELADSLDQTGVTVDPIYLPTRDGRIPQ